MTTFVDNTSWAKVGIALALYPTDPYANIEIQRADDDGGGDPDTGTSRTIAVTPPGKQFYVDQLPLDGANRHYRTRHIDGFATASGWTSWVAATPIQIPDPLPPIPLDPAMDLDMFVDPATGEITLYVNASSIIEFVRYDIAINSGSFPDATAGTQVATTDGDATIVVPTGSYQAVPGDSVKAAVAYYDAGGQLMGILRREETMGIFVDANPVLDEDDGVLNLYPNRGTHAAAVWYKVYTSGTPTKSDVVNTGTLTTDDPVTSIHTFTVDEERVQVGVVASENAGGTGIQGELKIVSYTYHNANNNPRITWLPYVPSTISNEGVRITAVDDSGTCRIFHRNYVDGAGPPGYTDTGLLSDPVVVSVSVARPAEGANATIVEFYAEDAAGNSSGEPEQVRVDGNLKPSGTYATDCNKSTGEPDVDISTTDPDTGSWRMRVSKSGYASIAFNDAAGDEFSGNSFNGESPDLSSYTLRKESGHTTLYCELQFYRTTSTDDGDQSSSISSDSVRFLIIQEEETENSVRLGGYAWYLTQTAGGPTWKFGFNIAVKGNVASVKIEYDFWDESASTSTPRSYWINVTGGSDVVHELQDATGTSDQVFEEGDGIAQGSLPFVFSDSVDVTPNDAAAGAGNDGETRRLWPTDYEGEGAVGGRATDGSSTYQGDAIAAGEGLGLVQNAQGRPEFVVKISYGTGAPGTLAEGEIYFQVPAV